MDGGVGDDYVDPTVLVFDPIGDLTKCRDVADVGFHRRCAPAVVLDLRNRLFEFIFCCGNGIRRRADRSGDVERDDVGAVRGKLDSDCATDPARGAGHYSDLSCER